MARLIMSGYAIQLGVLLLRQILCWNVLLRTMARRLSGIASLARVLSGQRGWLVMAVRVRAWKELLKRRAVRWRGWMRLRRLLEVTIAYEKHFPMKTRSCGVVSNFVWLAISSYSDGLT